MNRSERRKQAKLYKKNLKMMNNAYNTSPTMIHEKMFEMMDCMICGARMNSVHDTHNPYPLIHKSLYAKESLENNDLRRCCSKCEVTKVLPYRMFIVEWIDELEMETDIVKLGDKEIRHYKQNKNNYDIFWNKFNSLSEDDVIQLYEKVLNKMSNRKRVLWNTKTNEEETIDFTPQDSEEVDIDSDEEIDLPIPTDVLDKSVH